MFDLSGEERCAMEIEARQEMAWEAQEKRVKDLMQDHDIFIEFVAEQKGFEWISEITETIAQGGNCFSSSEMADNYREYCEMHMRENG